MIKIIYKELIKIIKKLTSKTLATSHNHHYGNRNPLQRKKKTTEKIKHQTTKSIGKIKHHHHHHHHHHNQIKKTATTTIAISRGERRERKSHEREGGGEEKFEARALGWWQLGSWIGGEGVD